MGNPSNHVDVPRPHGHLQSIGSIAKRLNKCLEGITILKTESPDGFENYVLASLSLIETEEKKLESLQNLRSVVQKNLVKSKYWVEARTKKQLTVCTQIVRGWMRKHKREFNFDVQTFPEDSLFWLQDGDEFWPLDSVIERILRDEKDLLDDYAIAYGRSKKLDWVTEQIKLLTSNSHINSDKQDSFNSDVDPISLSGFAEYISKKYRAGLINYLKEQYTNKKPQEFGFLLYALYDLSLIDPPTTLKQEELFNALKQTFGIGWTRQALSNVINDLNKPPKHKEFKINLHASRIKEYMRHSL